MNRWGITGVTIITPDDQIKNAALILKDNIIEDITEGKPGVPISIEARDSVLTRSASIIPGNLCSISFSTSGGALAPPAVLILKPFHSGGL